MTTMTKLTDEELLRQFDDASLPVESFHHQEHVRVAWLFVRRHGMPAALGAFSDALIRFAAAKGAHRLYHATITWAYVLLIHERQQHHVRPLDWERFAEANRDLLTWKPSILDRYYTPEALWSDRARRGFVMPDRGI